MRVNDFKWVKGENDYEYIQLLEAECKRKDEIISRAINKLKAARKTEPTISKMEQVDKEYPRCVINGTPFDECGFCEHFNCDTCKCEAQTVAIIMLEQ